MAICPTLKPEAPARNASDAPGGPATTGDNSAPTSGVFDNGSGSGVYGNGVAGARTPLLIPSGGMCDAEASLIAMSPPPASLETPAGTSVLSLALAQTKAKPRLR